eukprot:jgi/Mesen1/4255/ME000022S03547
MKLCFYYSHYRLLCVRSEYSMNSGIEKGDIRPERRGDQIVQVVQESVSEDPTDTEGTVGWETASSVPIPSYKTETGKTIGPRIVKSRYLESKPPPSTSQVDTRKSRPVQTAKVSRTFEPGRRSTHEPKPLRQLLADDLKRLSLKPSGDGTKYTHIGGLKTAPSSASSTPPPSASSSPSKATAKRSRSQPSSPKQANYKIRPSSPERTSVAPFEGGNFTPLTTDSKRIGVSSETLQLGIFRTSGTGQSSGPRGGTPGSSRALDLEGKKSEHFGHGGAKRKEEEILQEYTQLQLLVNRLLVWRVLNDRLEAAMLKQKAKSEEQLVAVYDLVRQEREEAAQLRMRLGDAERNQRLSVSLASHAAELQKWRDVAEGAKEAQQGLQAALEKASLQVPLVGGAQGDPGAVKRALEDAKEMEEQLQPFVSALSPQAAVVKEVLEQLSEAVAEQKQLLQKDAENLARLARLER